MPIIKFNMVSLFITDDGDCARLPGIEVVVVPRVIGVCEAAPVGEAVCVGTWVGDPVGSITPVLMSSLLPG